MNSSHVSIDPTIFKAYDVRGIYGQDLTDEIAYRIGRAAAHIFKRAGNCRRARYAPFITTVSRCADTWHD